MKRFFVLIAGMMLLSSCGAKRQAGKEQKNLRKTNRYIARQLDTKDTAAFDNVRLQEAKMADIPIPLSAKPLPEYFDPANPVIILGYEDTILSPAGIENFYVKEMERLGWQPKEQFIGYESKLRFIKPQRSCLITVRFDEHNQCTQFVISTGTKVMA